MPSPPNSISTGSSSTSSSLVQRLRSRNAPAWERFAVVYGPLVYGWARRLGLREEDARDVTQDVFRSVYAHIDQFRRTQPSDSFRGWMYTITRNRVWEIQRRAQGGPHAEGGTVQQQRLAQVAEPEELSQSGYSQSERNQLVRRAMKLVQAEFNAATWQAFSLQVFDGRAPADVASQLGLSLASVYQAKSRVLKRLRVELDEEGLAGPPSS